MSTDASPNAVPANDTLDPLLRETIEQRFALYPRLSQCDEMLFSLALERAARVKTSHSLPTIEITAQVQPPISVPLSRMVEAGIKIGTLPSVFHKIVDTVNSPFSSVQDIAATIATDPSLSARLLRLVNSPFYGLPTRIDTISRAVALVGNGPLVMLTMGTVLVSAFKGIPSTLINMQEFWQHSFSTGACAKTLARHAELEESESFFVAGLLHDIGRLIVFLETPENAVAVIMRSREKRVPMRDIEREILGFTHAELGAALLKEWHCPAQLIDYVLNHHTPIPGKPMPYEVILTVADTIVSALGHGSSSEFYIANVAPQTWETLNITPEDLPEIALSVEEHLVILSQMLA